MEFYLLLSFLFVGGIIGWSLFAFTMVRLIKNRKNEITMICEIKEELKIVKQEINNLK
jgi:hypothetical protein